MSRESYEVGLRNLREWDAKSWTHKDWEDYERGLALGEHDILSRLVMYDDEQARLAEHKANAQRPKCSACNGSCQCQECGGTGVDRDTRAELPTITEDEPT